MIGRLFPRTRNKQIWVGGAILLCATIVYASLHFARIPDGISVSVIEPGRRKAILVHKGISELNKSYMNGTTPSAVGLVMAKIRSDDIKWVLDYCKESEAIPFVYSTAEEPETHLLVPGTTRGLEVAAYLSYLIDFYDSLPRYSIFIHANADQWHNDLFGARTSDTLRHFRLEAVKFHGYANLRCTHVSGCPPGVFPKSPSQADIDKGDIRAYFAQAFQELFAVSTEDIPEALGSVCCSQFAVSRARIRERPREDYVRMLDWAANTNLTNGYGVGWVFEKIWQVVFGMGAVHCPSFDQCRCDNYGWCDPFSPSEEVLQAVGGPYNATT